MDPQDDPFLTQVAAADLAANRNAYIVNEYFDSVVRPCFRAMDQRVADIKALNDEVGSAFLLYDFEFLRDQTALTFTLAIQSLWERQFRDYVALCAEQLNNSTAMKHARGISWDKVPKAFAKLRQRDPNTLPRWEELELLQALGSACRHGPGPKLKELWESHSEFWPYRAKQALLPPMPGQDKGAPIESYPSLAGMQISELQLAGFVHAIAEFWDALTGHTRTRPSPAFLR